MQRWLKSLFKIPDCSLLPIWTDYSRQGGLSEASKVVFYIWPQANKDWWSEVTTEQFDLSQHAECRMWWRELRFPPLFLHNSWNLCQNPLRYLDTILPCNQSQAADGAYPDVVHVIWFCVMYCIYICKCCSYCDVSVCEARRTKVHLFSFSFSIIYTWLTL